MPHPDDASAAASAQPPPTPDAGCRVPLSHYREAVQQFFDCAPSDFELAAWQGQGPCHVRLGEQVYRVDSTRDLTIRAQYLLTDRNGAAMFPLPWAPMLLAGVHREPAFFASLRQQLAHEPFNLAQLPTIITLAQRAGPHSQTFWDALYGLADARLYPAAVVAASRTYDTARLLAAVVGCLTDASDDFLLPLQGQLLGTLVLNEAPAAHPSPAELAQEEYFYFYAVDECCWETTHVVRF